MGINGNLFMTFVVEKDGTVGDIHPVRCIGAGCESEAASVLANSPKWLPGTQKGKPVRVQYTVPINFSIPNGKVSLKDLRKSDYGFLFFIKGTTYTIDEAETILGKSFMSDKVEIAEPFNDEEKYPMPNKKEVYLIKMKA
ncbi:MAG: hypothetical protein EOO04_40020 [Chitinophagaceae bacterium]|nr:MAG: hypothetical protein EOO04_40020 [Chitinophagaceae bacterium]